MSSPPGSKRLLLAFLVAPLAAPIAYILGTLAVELVVRDRSLSLLSTLDLLIGVFTLGAPCAADSLSVGVRNAFDPDRLLNPGILGELA